MINRNTICRMVALLGVCFLLLQPVHSENIRDVFCWNAFTVKKIDTRRARKEDIAIDLIRKYPYLQKRHRKWPFLKWGETQLKSRKWQLLKWGETQLERKRDITLLKTFVEGFFVAQLADLPRFWRNEILKAVSFSESERQKLLREPQLKKPIKEIRVKLPEKTNETQSLKEQGFNSAYVRGIDEANEWIAIAEQLKAEEVNPYITHVDYFPRKTMEHIKHLEKGVETPRQRRELLRWRKYVEKKQRNKKFTYSDWLEVNWALAKILGDTDFYFSPEDVGRRPPLDVPWHIERLVYAFPRKIAIPTTTTFVGIETLNRAGTHGVHPLGLRLFAHDIFHTLYTDKYPPIRFYRGIRRMSRHFPIRKRKNIKLGYWLITHENRTIQPFGYDWLSSVEEMKLTLRKTASDIVARNRGPEDELRGLIDISNKEKIDQQMEQVFQDFTEIYILVQNQVVRATP